MAIIRISSIILAVSLLLTGCSGFYTSIPKDTVMVKKIIQETPADEVEYNGVLSEETVKTLSISAVNKYYSHNLSLDDIEFEGFSMDQAQIKELLAKNTKDLYGEQGFLVEFKTQLSKVPSGIYIVAVMNKYDATDIYNVVMNAKDGDVVAISKVVISEKTKVEKKPTVQRLSELETIGDQFIAGMDDYKPADLVLDDTSYRYGGSTAELYYKSKENDAIVLNIVIDVDTQKVVGFYKDIMTVLQYIVSKYAFSIMGY
ncbi:hypothetical protein [Paenibacillus mendelii]|uniref:Deacetylase PdaC domain-containing protein n=1 Tax=Paenibacillus mendelii TaxID=206163 RepID=A0ABV6JCU3_9BACL|nr:hypothetical protein [Paenibacillus mendelii]MCQ6559781.1 hypothetical protein [Paenibacillus mendelii]